MTNRNAIIYLIISAIVGSSSAAIASNLSKTTSLPSTNNNQPHSPTLLAKSTYDTELLQLTNAQRAKVGAPPLKLNPKLDKAADKHAKDMANNSFLSHTGSDGSRMSDRVEEAGYDWMRVSENVSAGSATPEATIQQWMSSPQHRRNMLNPNYTEVGFGYASNSSSEYTHYWAQVFAAPAN